MAYPKPRHTYREYTNGLPQGPLYLQRIRHGLPPTQLYLQRICHGLPQARNTYREYAMAYPKPVILTENTPWPNPNHTFKACGGLQSPKPRLIFFKNCKNQLPKTGTLHHVTPDPCSKHPLKYLTEPIETNSAARRRTPTAGTVRAWHRTKDNIITGNTKKSTTTYR